MLYHLRYVTTSPEPLLPGALDAVVRAADRKLGLAGDVGEVDGAALVRRGLFGSSATYGRLTVRAPGEPVADDCLALLRRQLPATPSPERDRVAAVLDGASRLLTLQVTHEGWGHSRAADALWAWLFEHHPGILHVEDDGFWDASGPLLAAPR